MKRSTGFLAIIPAVAFGLSLSAPAFAQDAGAPSASASGGMTQTMKNAGTDTENAAKGAYNTTATAIDDTDITAKVKVALDKNETTEHAKIHVKTVAGVVTLTGRVKTMAISEQADQIAKSTEGVSSVNNHLRIRSSASSSNS